MGTSPAEAGHGRHTIIIFTLIPLQLLWVMFVSLACYEPFPFTTVFGQYVPPVGLHVFTQHSYYLTGPFISGAVCLREPRHQRSRLPHRQRTY
jgi:hypothetical protein